VAEHSLESAERAAETKLFVKTKSETQQSIPIQRKEMRIWL
jgi:hypothetical protein